MTPVCQTFGTSESSHDPCPDFDLLYGLVAVARANGTSLKRRRQWTWNPLILLSSPRRCGSKCQTSPPLVELDDSLSGSPTLLELPSGPALQAVVVFRLYPVRPRRVLIGVEPANACIECSAVPTIRRRTSIFACRAYSDERKTQQRSSCGTRSSYSRFVSQARFQPELSSRQIERTHTQPKSNKAQSPRYPPFRRE